MPYCSPDRERANCFTKDEERYMIKLYNRLSPRRTLRSLTELRVPSACLVSEFAKLGVPNGTLKILKRMTERAHLPRGPGDEDAWLWSTHISATMAKWVRTLPPTFKFLGAVPADFYRKGELLAQVLRDSRPGSLFGMVVNTDPSHRAGEHWVAMLIEKTRSGAHVEYFDAVGESPNRYVKAVLKQLPGNVSVEVNTVEHQQEDGQCGVFGIYYLLSRATKVYNTMSEFNKHPHTDSDMKRFRPSLFRPVGMCE